MVGGLTSSLRKGGRHIIASCFLFHLYLLDFLNGAWIKASGQVVTQSVQWGVKSGWWDFLCWFVGGVDGVDDLCFVFTVEGLH